MLRALPLSLLVFVSAVTPAMAMNRLTFTSLLLLSHPLLKLLILVLGVATIAAMVICALKLKAGSKLVGGSAFVKALRLGGPLLGLLGGSYAAMNIFIGLSSFPTMVDPVIFMPAIAEAIAVLIVGLISGVVAVVANWAIEARIDREVLRIQ